MDQPSEPLHQLAQACGIALAYHDIWGNEHRAKETTLIALLNAMGVRAAERDEAQSALAAKAASEWLEVLPPVCVTSGQSNAAAVTLRLDAALVDRPLHWSIETIELIGSSESNEAPTDRLEAPRTGRIEPGCLPELGQATVGGRLLTAREWRLPTGLPLGYHRLQLLTEDQVLGTCRLIVAPRRCYRPAALGARDAQGREGRVWGVAAQLYSLRSERNWGIGDFTDLAAAVELWGLRGAALVGVNPLHALFTHNPAHISPYSPSSRLFLNTLYLDVEAIHEFRDCEPARSRVASPEFQARLTALRDAELIDHVDVAQAKREILELVYAHFRRAHADLRSSRALEFDRYRLTRGAALRRQALYDALQEHFHKGDPDVWGWPVWPEEFRDPSSSAVADFERARVERVEFFEYLQWQADAQLGNIGRRSLELGLAVGLYADLAVSIDRAGADAWADQEVYATSVSIGAPPDDFNLHGQNWGLPPLNPRALRTVAYEPLIAMLRANMEHAGALRIDHVMALMRLFWIPQGAQADQGTYVAYPFDDLLGVLALESHRNRCLVIGEDLGTVPDEARRKLADAGVLSYRLLYFERRPSGEFKAPGEHERQALLAASTHDLPTLSGWWLGRDLDLRTALNLFPRAEMRELQVIERAQDRARLLLALEREGLLPSGATTSPVSMPHMTPEFSRSIHAMLARSSAQVVVAQLEDVFEVADQINVPGTTNQHPNWRRKLPVLLERWPADERVVELARILEAERGGSPVRPGRAAGGAVIPRVTYRLQLHREFTFAQAAALVPYLAELGVSHVYCSPFLRARPGSRHGYDIVDHSALSPEIGTREDFEALVAALRSHGMGMLIDVVPNHMGVLGGDNAWWLDVLESGAASPFSDFFDIDWQSADRALTGKVLLPILGDQYGMVLERGEITLEFDAHTGGFALRYFEHRLPLDPRTYPMLLEPARRLLTARTLPPEAIEALEGIIAAFAHLPNRDSAVPGDRAERRRDKQALKERLARLVDRHGSLRDAIDQVMGRVGSRPERPGGRIDRRALAELDALIEAQAFRLAFWRVAADEINYRRFFDINELAALRVEDPEVFNATHRLVLDLLSTGKADGLRIDHPDGLADPAGYFARLQERFAQLTGRPGAGLAADGSRARPLYVVAEKIVAAHEHLPTDWAVHGTTGYRFANLLNGVFVDVEAKARTDRVWRGFVRDEAVGWEDQAYRCRRLVMGSALAGELTVLANRLLRVARADPRTRDFTLNSLRQALAEVVANFPVYRTYIVERPSAQDRRFIDWAVGRARRRGRATDPSVFDFIRSVLLGRTPPGAVAGLAADYRAFVVRLQQFTAPVAAKGIEDTAFYRHHRLVSLNEVGGDPETFGVTVAAFHGASHDRAQHWSHTMLATSTHDTKRSEDARARINVISEQPAAWRLAVRRWSRINRSKKRTVDGAAAPSRLDEYLLYQTLIGTFPAGEMKPAGLVEFRERIEQFMLKAARESKLHTSWINRNQSYEAALSGFVNALLGRLEGNLFLDDLRAAIPTFAWYGALSGISMAALKYASPGVPDIYQGCEGLVLAMVDPDNRRNVDFNGQREALRELREASASEGLPARLREWLLAAADGRAKRWTIWRALQLRRQREELFRHGDYQALRATGPRARHVIAFARRHRDDIVIVAAGRLFASMGLEAGQPPIGDAWADTGLVLDEIPGIPETLIDALSGKALTLNAPTLSLSAVLGQWPAAVLTTIR